MLLNFLELEPSIVNQIFEDFKQHIYIISFPGFQRDNLLIQSILGHELGHPIADEYLKQEPKNYKYDIGVEVQKVYGSKWEGLAEGERDKKKTEIIDKIVSVRNGFISEILSDLVASYVFNLAGLFALSTYCYSEPDIDTPDIDVEDPHPAWRTRLRFVYVDFKAQDLSVLDREFSTEGVDNEFHERISEAIKRKMQEIEVTVEDTRDQTILENDPVTRIAYRFVTEALPNMKSFLDGRVPRHRLEHHYREVIKCARRLFEGIPPNATNEHFIYEPKIANLQTILIGGSLYKETFLSSMPLDQGKKYRETLDQLNQLLTKALELSLIHSEFHKHRWAEDRMYKHRRILFKRFS